MIYYLRRWRPSLNPSLIRHLSHDHQLDVPPSRDASLLSVLSSKMTMSFRLNLQVLSLKF